MKIKCSKQGVRQIYNRTISDEPVIFVDGIATVDKEVGELLIANYPDLAAVKSKAKNKKED